MSTNDQAGNKATQQVWWSKKIKPCITSQPTQTRIPKSTGIKKTKDSNEFYHAQKEYISSSALKTISKQSVFHYINEEFKTSEALVVGSAFHTLVLEGKLFDKEFIVMPKFDKRTKAGKQQAKLFDAEMIAQNKVILARPNFDMIIEMRKMIAKDEPSVDLLRNGEPEMSFYVEDFMDLKVRVRPDSIGESYIVDLKSCQDASPKAFKRDVWKYNWHLQAAFYMDVLGYDTFYFLASEKKAPYACQVYQLGDDMIHEGRKLYQQAIEQWKQYLESGEAPKYHHHSMEEGIITL